MASPTLTYNSATLVNSFADLDLTYPSGISADDLLIILAATDDTAGASRFDTPAGYTHRGTWGNGTSDSVLDIFTKVADGTETGTIAVPNSDTTNRDRVGFVIRATHASGVLYGMVGTEAINLGTTVVAPSITTSDDDGLILCVGAFDGADYGTISYNNGFTLEADDGANGGAGIGLHFGSKDQATGGVVGATTVTASVSDGQVALQMSFHKGAGSASAPVNTVAPVVTGAPGEGSTLTTTDGTWTGSPTPTYTYQWQRDAVNISGATAATYVTVSADVGTDVTCDVTGTNTEGNATASSNAITIIDAVPIPTVTFTSATLTASNADLDLTYPASIAAGELIAIVAVSNDTAGVSRFDTPVGYTHRGTFGDATSDSVIDLFTKAADGTETGTVTVPASDGVTRDRAGFCIRITSTTDVELGVVGVGATINGNDLDAPAVTTPENYSLLISLFAFDTTNYGPFTYTAGYTEQSAIEAGVGVETSFATGSLDLAGLSGVCNVSHGGVNDGIVGVQFAVNGGVLTAPANTVAPVLTSPSTTYGTVFSVAPGTWTGDPTPTFTYAWYRDAVVIPGETGSTYTTIPHTDTGVEITAKVTGTNGAGAAVATSNGITVTVPNQLPAKTFTVMSRLESPLGTLESIDFGGRNHEDFGGFIAQSDLRLTNSSIRVQKAGGLIQDFEFFVRINGGTAVSLESEIIGFESLTVTSGHNIAITAGDEVELLFTCANNTNIGIFVSASFEDATAKSIKPFLITAFYNPVTGTDRDAIFSGNSHNFNVVPVASSDFTITGVGYYCETGNLTTNHAVSIDVDGTSYSVGSFTSGTDGGSVTGLSIPVTAGDLIEVFSNDGGSSGGDDCRVALQCTPVTGDPYSPNEFMLAYQDTDLNVAQEIAPFISPVACTITGCSFATPLTGSGTIDMIINGGTPVEMLSYSITGEGMQAATGLAIAVAAGDKVAIYHNGTGTTGLGGTTAVFFEVAADDLPAEPGLPEDTWPSEPTDDFPEALPYGSLNGASGGPQGNKIAFEPEFGPSIDRRKGSYTARYISIELPPLTAGQYATWQNFYHTFLKNGSIPMTYPDPITKAEHTFQFKQGKPGVREAALPDGRIKINFDLIRID